MINACCDPCRQTLPQSLQCEAGRARSPFEFHRQCASANLCSRKRKGLSSKCTCQLGMKLARAVAEWVSACRSDLPQIAICFFLHETFPPFCPLGATREGEFIQFRLMSSPQSKWKWGVCSGVEYGSEPNIL